MSAAQQETTDERLTRLEVKLDRIIAKLRKHLENCPAASPDEVDAPAPPTGKGVSQ